MTEYTAEEVEAYHRQSVREHVQRERLLNGKRDLILAALDGLSIQTAKNVIERVTGVIERGTKVCGTKDNNSSLAAEIATHEKCLARQREREANSQSSGCRGLVDP